MVKHLQLLISDEKNCSIKVNNSLYWYIQIDVESFNFVGAIFLVCQFFTGSWDRNFVDWLLGGGGLEGKLTFIYYFI